MFRLPAALRGQCGAVRSVRAPQPRTRVHVRGRETGARARRVVGRSGALPARYTHRGVVAPRRNARLAQQRGAGADERRSAAALAQEATRGAGDRESLRLDRGIAGPEAVSERDARATPRYGVERPRQYAALSRPL